MTYRLPPKKRLIWRVLPSEKLIIVDCFSDDIEDVCLLPENDSETSTIPVTREPSLDILEEDIYNVDEMEWSLTEDLPLATTRDDDMNMNDLSTHTTISSSRKRKHEEVSEYVDKTHIKRRKLNDHPCKSCGHIIASKRAYIHKELCTTLHNGTLNDSLHLRPIDKRKAAGRKIAIDCEDSSDQEWTPSGFIMPEKSKNTIAAIHTHRTNLKGNVTFLVKWTFPLTKRSWEPLRLFVDYNADGSIDSINSTLLNYITKHSHNLNLKELLYLTKK